MAVPALFTFGDAFVARLLASFSDGRQGSDVSCSALIVERDGGLPSL